MADTKISALPASTTPLAGTEVLPIVQSSATKQVSVANLTAGRAISATQLTLTTGNLVIGTSGKGIDFSITSHPAGMTSELLADYEEGTFTPEISCDTPGNLTIVYGSRNGYYTKVGRLVTVNFFVSTSTFTHTTASGNFQLTGLPFTASNATQNLALGGMIFDGITKIGYTQFQPGIGFGRSYAVVGASGSAVAYANLQITDVPSGGTPFVYFTVSYIV
jgi:hypothetical protein